MNANALVYLYRALVMLIAIPFHEAAHALVSWRLGDSTAKDYGRLSLNPIRHFDPLGAICMIAAGIGWAKPVPTDVRRFRNPKRDMALTALAGPAANLLLAYASMLLYKWIETLSYLVHGEAALTVLYYCYLFFYYMVALNVALAVFNMLPVPPFDGSRILLAFLPERWYFGIMRYERYLFLAVFALLMLGVFDTPLYVLRTAVWNAMDFATGYMNAENYLPLFSAVAG
jgi:Zn-dependent protease